MAKGVIMSGQDVLAALGLAGLAESDVLAVQIILAIATLFVFLVSLGVMFSASRSARVALAARADSEANLRSAQDFAVEARQLAAKFGKGGEPSEPANVRQPIRVSARETTAEAEVLILDGDDGEREAGARNLDAAKDAATIPAGLLRGRPRRRR